ncbi:MAG: AI-2E family transporter [Nibricoccus sp.]
MMEAPLDIIPPTSRSRHIIFAFTLLVLAIIFWRIRDVLMVTFGGIIGAIILRALAQPLAKRTRLSEAWSVIITVLLITVILCLFGWFFGNQTATELGEMQTLLPKAWDKLKEALQTSSGGRLFLNAVDHASGDAKFLTGVGFAASAMLGGLGEASLVIFLSVYFALSPSEYTEGFLSLLPPAQRERMDNALSDACAALRKWLIAQLWAMLIVGLLVGISLATLRMPLALVLGVLAGLLEFIPLVGPVLFTIPALLVASTQSVSTVWYVLIVYVGVQLLESNVITPILQRWAVRLPPAVTLLSVVIGGMLLGPTGVIYGIPLTVAGLAMLKYLYTDTGSTYERKISPIIKAIRF